MAAPSSWATFPKLKASLPLLPKRFGPIWSVPMHGAIVSSPLFRNVRIAGVAQSTSQVTQPITAPFEMRLDAHRGDTSSVEVCVLLVSIFSGRRFTPPAALILAISSWAAVNAGLLNG